MEGQYTYWWLQFDLWLCIFESALAVVLIVTSVMALSAYKKLTGNIKSAAVFASMVGFCAVITFKAVADFMLYIAGHHVFDNIPK